MALNTLGLSVLVCGILINSPAVFGQCLRVTPMVDLMSRRSVEVIFSGVVTNIEHTSLAETVSFSVEWVFKGSVGTRTKIARPIPVASGSAPAPVVFAVKNRYVVSAHHVIGAERQDIGLSDSQVQFGTDMCGSGSRLLSEAQSELSRIGPGHAPEGQSAGLTRPFPSRIPRAFPPVKIKDAAPEVPNLIDVRGTVILEITIDASGHVRDPQILRSVAGFDQAAIDSVMAWEYAPALLDGVPVPVRMTVTIPIGAGPRATPVR